MSELGHFAIFDLTKIGTAYQIINSFVDDETIHAFEICPLGSQAVLMISSKDLISLQFVYSQCLSLHKADILNAAFIENLNPKIIETYLSQNKPKITGSLLIAESESFATAFQYVQNLMTQNISLIDLRVVRTGPPSIIITATADISTLDAVLNSKSVVKVTLIDQVQKSLKSYFEILN